MEKTQRRRKRWPGQGRLGFGDRGIAIVREEEAGDRRQREAKGGIEGLEEEEREGVG